MPQKQAVKKIYRSANGKLVDIEQLRQKNELTPAVGNVRVNARGDQLGPGGKIIKTREDIVQEFYQQSETYKPSNPTTFDEFDDVPIVPTPRPGLTINQQSQPASVPVVNKPAPQAAPTPVANKPVDKKPSQEQPENTDKPS